MQARRHSAIWTVNRRAAGLDWKSSGRFGAGDQGLRCPPPQESQPDRRAGTASNTDGTERCEAQVLGSPP